LLRRRQQLLAARMACAASVAGFVALATSPAQANDCRPRRPKPTVHLTDMGPCSFVPERLAFAGDPAAQARCLVRPLGVKARLGPVLDRLPPVLEERIGQDVAMPSRRAVAAVLAEMGLDRQLAPTLLHPVSRAQDGDLFAPAARYFVIHDTSGPLLRRFPENIDSAARFNNLANFRCTDGFAIAHAVINRSGGIYLGHDFEVPWRATKFERAVRFGTDLKGLFLHVEMIQPRRGRGGTLAPTPGFTAAQYDRLALLYALASVRAGAWLVPAFHAAIDGGLRNGHDDPQNFELKTFAKSLDGLVKQFDKTDERLVSEAAEAGQGENTNR
jgi:hypothetical protein